MSAAAYADGVHAGHHAPQQQSPPYALSDRNHDMDASEDDQSGLPDLGFLKPSTTETKQTKAGQPAKRRGPKPDSKPALTRRQELNRQAQRTHRERKEMYIKALEEQVSRLKEIYAETARERNRIAEENRRLKQLLAQHGLAYTSETGETTLRGDGSPNMPSSSGSFSGSYRNPSDSTSLSPPDHNLANVSFGTPPPPSQHRNMGQLPNTSLDYDQIGIDFVLTLERPCMDHMQHLMVRSQNPEAMSFHLPMLSADDALHAHMSGHALMAAGVPHSHLMLHPSEPYPHQMPRDLDTPSLVKLLDLSGRIPLDREGEITPIMAWSSIFQCDHVAQLAPADFEFIKASLSDKVRCYGFGAVLEEFEVRDALNAVLEEKRLSPATTHVR